MEKRKYLRLNTAGMEVNISDRFGFSTGTIKDISRFGVCIADLPRKLQTKDNIVVAIISANGQQYKLLLKPQWEKQDGLTIVTGTKIDGVPRDWMQMILQMEQSYNPNVSPETVAQNSGKTRVVKTLRRGVVTIAPPTGKVN